MHFHGIVFPYILLKNSRTHRKEKNERLLLGFGQLGFAPGGRSPRRAAFARAARWEKKFWPL
jgi:hypothetical protein